MTTYMDDLHITRQEFCWKVSLELAALENDDFKVGIITWSSYDAPGLAKAFEGEAAWVPGYSTIHGGGTDPHVALPLLRQLAATVPPGPTLILWITDGEWEGDPVEIFAEAEAIIPGSTCGAVGIGDPSYTMQEQFQNVAEFSGQFNDFVANEIERLERLMQA